MCAMYTPAVIASNEFLQIANDFGEPLEIVREALSNAYDSGATQFSFEVTMDGKSGKTIIEMRDNGCGMSYEVLRSNFWDLGNSYAHVQSADTIGEKGHGTKIYLRSDLVYVLTCDGASVSEATCIHPYEALSKGQMHQVEISEAELDEKLLPYGIGTYIKVVGYNNSDTSVFSQGRVEDYSYWFTKLGSFEGELPGKKKKDFTLNLKALGANESMSLPFGHRFAEENYNIDVLYDTFKDEAADHFAKRYVYPNQTLNDHPECKFDLVAYVEGEEAKRSYNKMLRKRKNQGKGYYSTGERYGLWLAKDYIPVERKNGWVTSFGTGSNSVIMLHGFINCQQFSLTANRRSVANTDPQLLDDLQDRVAELISQINNDAYRVHGLKELSELGEAEKRDNKEQEEYDTRIQKVKTRKYYLPINGIRLYEPSNEAELANIFMLYYASYSDQFDFEPVDYVTSVGVDMLARSKSGSNPADTDYWYVELKKSLTKAEFNHSFKNIRYIVCWDIDEGIGAGHEFKSALGETRLLHVYPDTGSGVVYRLEDPSGICATSIQVVQLKPMVEKATQLDE